MPTKQCLLQNLLLALSGIVGAAELGQPAPPCTLTTFADEQPIRIRDHRGHVVYVDFWASWCSPCAQSFPFLNELYRDFSDSGLHIIGVNLDTQRSDASAFLAGHPAYFPIAMDVGKRCPQAFDVKGMPSAYLIDKKGLIRHIHIGFRGDEARKELRGWVERLLAEDGS